MDRRSQHRNSTFKAEVGNGGSKRRNVMIFHHSCVGAIAFQYKYVCSIYDTDQHNFTYSKKLGYLMMSRMLCIPVPTCYSRVSIRKTLVLTLENIII